MESISHVHQHEGDRPGLEQAGGRRAAEPTPDHHHPHGVVHGQARSHRAAPGGWGGRASRGRECSGRPDTTQVLPPTAAGALWLRTRLPLPRAESRLPAHTLRLQPYERSGGTGRFEVWVQLADLGPSGQQVSASCQGAKSQVQGVSLFTFGKLPPCILCVRRGL